MDFKSSDFLGEHHGLVDEGNVHPLFLFTFEILHSEGFKTAITPKVADAFITLFSCGLLDFHEFFGATSLSIDLADKRILITA